MDGRPETPWHVGAAALTTGSPAAGETAAELPVSDAAPPAPHRALPAPARRSRVRRVAGLVVGRVGVTLVAAVLLAGFLSPLVLSMTVSVKSIDQLSGGASILPMTPRTFSFEGRSLDVYRVPIDGTVRELALVGSSRVTQIVTFIDPASPGAPEITWKGNRFELERATELDPQYANFSTAFGDINFLKLLLNTVVLALIETVGVLLSCTIVAYGFARFRFPGRNVLFILLIATIFLPTFATVVPIYTIFNRIGWMGTWYPLIVPTFFANAYDVFLIRQFLMTIPRDLDEAAAIDGAGPVRTLVSVILPQAWPAIAAVAIFTFIYSWNDLFGPLLYVSTNPDLWTLAYGLATFHGQRNLQEPGVVQAATLMSIVIPILFFAVFQRFFVRGIRITGVEK